LTFLIKTAVLETCRYYKPEEAKVAEAARAGKLEARIAKLEKLLGDESLAPVAAELEQQDPSVHSALNALTERVAALSVCAVICPRCFCRRASKFFPFLGIRRVEGSLVFPTDEGPCFSGLCVPPLLVDVKNRIPLVERSFRSIANLPPKRVGLWRL
jgi:hypothetical protein